jgi:CheY-like chemotaxis protein/EAL domain-containing protein (putative c-di-GMP-specific phosphodiesterase class I)
MPDPRIRILVVDDDFATRLLASEALLADGFEPLEAEDGREAIEQYDRSSPAVILLDVHMPGIDGYEVCRRIRLRSGGDSTAIIVMTATDDIDAVERAFAAGATDFLTKPLNLPLLAHRVRFTLRAAATATAARDAANRQARAQRLARIVHWQLGADDRLVWASDPLAVFWPDAPSDRAGEPLIAFLHPDDRARVEAVLASRTEHQLEFRLQFPDGSERFARQDAELDFDSHGIVLIGATQDISDMKHAEQQIAQLAFYDDRTGIPNRPFVERYLRRADRGIPRSAIAIELGTGHLDHLPNAARDALIRSATARVIERVRGTDLDNRLDQPPRPVEAFTAPTLVAWTGPDELVVLTTELTAGTGAAWAYQLADVLAQPFAIAGGDVALRPRLGVADYPGPVADLRRLPDQAHTVARDASRTAPDNLVILTTALRDDRARGLELATELSLTLDVAALAPHPDLTIDYTPRLDPATRRVFGVRARPRWRVADVAPLVARDPRLRERLAAWTLSQACRDAGPWLAAGIALRLAIELPHAAVAAPGFTDELLHRLADHQFEPLLFDLELLDVPSDPTDLARLVDALHAIRHVGVRVALACVDDRRSLGELARLPLDTLRLTPAAIDRLGPAFVAMVAAIARGLVLRIAAVDLTTAATLTALEALDVHELAGPLFGVPVDAAGVPAVADDPARRSRFDSVAPATGVEHFVIGDL